MILSFETHDIRRLCEDDIAAADRFGAATANLLHARLADLRAARTIVDLPAGRPDLTGDLQDSLTIQLGDAAVLLATPGHPTIPRDERGLVDWTRVLRLRVVRIEAI